jgi:hypothetical protein
LIIDIIHMNIFALWYQFPKHMSSSRGFVGFLLINL